MTTTKSEYNSYGAMEGGLSSIPNTAGRRLNDRTPLILHEKRERIEQRKMSLVSTDALLFGTFLMFGTFVPMQFGVVVTAANDLVGNAAPPSVVLFAYTVPSIIIRMFVPYITFPDLRKIFSRTPEYSKIGNPETQSKEVDYVIRLSICAASSLFGLQLLAWANSVPVRVLGIAFASLSSNLGDMSFLQLATRYPGMISSSFGGYAAGSGAAGLIGSFLYTLFTTSFGARPSSVLSLIGFFPSIVLLVYLFILPSAEEVAEEVRLRSKEGLDSPLDVSHKNESVISILKLSDKLRIAGPLIWGYMMPLAVLMFLENITTQGILPTILWTLPFSPTSAPALSSFFKATRDFYPFFFTIYQLAVFFGRSSISLFRLPGHNERSSTAYWGLCAIELVCVFAMVVQSASMVLPKLEAGGSESMFDPNANIRFSPLVAAGIMFLMGICGGLGMGNTYWRVSKKPLPDSVWDALDRAKMRHLRGGVRTFESQEAGLLSAREEEGAGQEGYFDSQTRLRKSTPTLSERGMAGSGSSSGSSPTLVEEDMEEIRLGRKRDQREETAVREFLVSTIALPDTMAILLASIAGLWLQPEMCRWQVAGGRELCMAAASHGV